MSLLFAFKDNLIDHVWKTKGQLAWSLQIAKYFAIPAMGVLEKCDLISVRLRWECWAEGTLGIQLRQQYPPQVPPTHTHPFYSPLNPNITPSYRDENFYGKHRCKHNLKQCYK